MNEISNILETRVGSAVKPEKPAVSIVIPNYKTADYISETLDSVLAQTFQDYEIIVINDASPDTEKLKTVLESYADQIVFVDKSRNEGTSAARNRAVKFARADLIAFLDADDLWQPTFLQELYDFLRANKYQMAYTDAEVFGLNADGRNFLSINPPQGDITRELLIGGKCHILPSGMLIEKSVFENCGGFDPKVARTEDFDLWMRLIFSETRIGYLRKILFKFRLRPESGSGDSLQRIKRCIDIWYVLREKLPFTDAENQIIQYHIDNAQAELLRAEGRAYLNQKNWAAAKTAFRQARKNAKTLGLPFKHRLKLSAVLWLLDLSPTILMKLFHNLRSEEIRYMPNSNQV